MSSSSFESITNSLLVGFLENCQLFFLTLLIAIPLGLLVAFGSMSKIKPLAWFAKTIVWIIRGTPLMLQIFVVYYVPGLVFHMPVRNKLLAALIAFSINYACYFSEIYRGGIESISKGQYEAGQVLGLTKSETFFRVVLLQVVKRILPPMSNEIITLVKDTSLARVIAIDEILDRAYDYANFGLIWPLFYTGVFFLLFNGGLSLLFGYIEKKLSYFRS